MPRWATGPLEWLSPLPGLQPSPWNPYSRLLTHQGLAEMHLLNEAFLATLSKTETPSPTLLMFFFLLSYVLIVFIFRAILAGHSKMESTEFPYTPCPSTHTTHPHRQHPSPGGTFVRTDEPLLTSYNRQSAWFMLQFTLGDICSLDLDKCIKTRMGFPGGSLVKNPPANAGDAGLIPGSGRSPGKGNGNPLQYSCLENSVDREDWQATGHRITQSQTLSMHTPIHR